MMLAQGSSTIFSPSNLKLLIYGSVVVIMIVSRVVKAAKEAAEKKRIEDAMKRAELEALRTGRPVPTAVSEAPEMSAAERMQELARKREQEIRASPVATAPQTRPTTPPITSTPVRTSSRPQQRPDRPSQKVRKSATPAPPKASPVESPRGTTKRIESHESDTHRLVPDAPSVATSSDDAEKGEWIKARADLRKAIVLREVLDPPLCLRD